MRWQVKVPGEGPLKVDAGNWLVALGLALELVEHEAGPERLVAETLPNGVVIARDVGTGLRIVLEPVGEEVGPRSEIYAAPTLEPTPSPANATSLASLVASIPGAISRLVG